MKRDTIYLVRCLKKLQRKTSRQAEFLSSAIQAELNRRAFRAMAEFGLLGR